MSSHYKPDHYPHLMPYLTVKDGDKAFDFYRDAFGFSEHHPPMREDEKIVHASMRLNDCVIMFSPEGAFGGQKKSPSSNNTPANMGLYVYVDDVDALHAKATQNGAHSISTPEDMFWGDRTCTLSDPDGYEWTFATYKNT